MRIIGGTAGGRLLKSPKGFDVRPTPDLVRQAVFNSLGARVIDAVALELFGGTGALSLECLSRGAKHAVCIEKSQKHAQVIRGNFALCALRPRSLDVRVQDVFVALGQLEGAREKFDLILADPPFGEKNIGKRSESLAQKTLDDPRLASLLAGDGLLVMGHAKRDTLSVPDRWEEVKVMKHGDSIMRFLRLNPGRSAAMPEGSAAPTSEMNTPPGGD